MTYISNPFSRNQIYVSEKADRNSHRWFWFGCQHVCLINFLLFPVLSLYDGEVNLIRQNIIQQND